MEAPWTDDTSAPRCTRNLFDDLVEERRGADEESVAIQDDLVPREIAGECFGQIAGLIASSVIGRLDSYQHAHPG